VVKKGSGPFKVAPRDVIQVRLTGRTANGKIFKTSYTPPDKGSNTTILQNLTPNPIRIRGRTILLVKGLRRGLLGMKKGEKRIITVPPSMGYVNSGREVHGVKVYNKKLIYNVQLVRIAQ
jgi:FKBP-type peptidyl-prolyl cis-trans isomerase